MTYTVLDYLSPLHSK